MQRLMMLAIEVMLAWILRLIISRLLDWVAQQMSERFSNVVRFA